MRAPETIAEWEAYIEALPREKLWSKCRAANTFTFARTLITEGMVMEDLATVMRLFVRRMVELQIKLPEGGAFNLYKISETDPMSAF